RPRPLRRLRPQARRAQPPVAVPPARTRVPAGPRPPRGAMSWMRPSIATSCRGRHGTRHALDRSTGRAARLRGATGPAPPRRAGRAPHHGLTLRLAWTVTPCWTRAAAPLFCAMTMMPAAALPDPFIALDMLKLPVSAEATPPSPPRPPLPPVPSPPVASPPRPLPPVPPLPAQDEASPLPPLLLAVLAPPVAPVSAVDVASAWAWLSALPAPAPISLLSLAASA